MKRFMAVTLLFVLGGFGPGARADVTFYGQCDYQGNGISLAPGDYTAHELQQLGIPDNAISSIDVPRGFAVTVYEDDLFRGRYGTLRRSDPCLENDRFDKVISSLTIRETLDTLATTPDPQAVPAGADNVVTVFTDCEFRGRSAALAIGDYNLAQLQRAGIDSNQVSSVKVPPGLEVVLYDHDFLRGRAGRLRNDDSCLDNDGFDDVTSSLSVRAEGAGESLSPTVAANTPSSQRPTLSGKAGRQEPAAPVVLYTECNYSGQAVPLDAGEYTTAELQAKGLENNSVSSIRVQAGYEIELYEHDFHRGQSGTLRQNDDCLVDDRFNDVISSVIVKKDSAATSVETEQPVAAIVYGYCDFKGPSVALTAGRYDAAALARQRIAEDVIASLKVAEGYQVTLFENGNFTGTRKRFDAHDDCLDDDRLLERVSAVLIEPVSASAASGQARRLDTDDDQAARAERAERASRANRNDNRDDVPSLTELLPPPPGGRSTRDTANDTARLDKALACVGQYVEQNVCDSHRWRDMVGRCGLADIALTSDGYLKGHIDAGNCRAELWDELSRRVANPRLR